MHRRKIMSIMIRALCVGFVCYFVASRFSKDRKQSHTTPLYIIGILQTASHPALDAAREGFIEELTKTMGLNIDFIIRNGEGSIASMHTIAQQFHNNSQIGGVFAIATPAAQAMATVEQDKPIFIAAVTDPYALGLMHATTNVCGVQDMVDVKAEIDMLTQLLPNARTVGLIYNNGEVNSVAVVDMMHAELNKKGLTAVDFAVNSESDLPTAAQMAFLKSDVVLTPIDNMVASSITLLASLAHQNKKPLIVSDNMLVAFGALAARGVDYKESGKQVAHIAWRVLNGGENPYENPWEIPIVQAQSDTLYINKNVIKDLGLIIPSSLGSQIVWVE